MVYFNMNFLSKLFNKTTKTHLQDELFLSLDIGTEVAKGLLFKITDLGVTIVASYYVNQPLKAMQAGRVLDIDLVYSTANQVIDGLFKEINKVRIPNIKTIFGIAGELINGISVNAYINRMYVSNKPITEKEESVILTNLFDQIIVDGKQELANILGVTTNEVVVLNVSVNSFFVDGVFTSNIVGKTGSRISANLYASFAPVSVIKNLADITKKLRINLSGIVVQPYAVARSFKDVLTDPNFSGIFIDIGGGTTDIALVTEGGSIQTQMFAFGGRGFTQKIAKEFNLSYQLAEQRKIQYSSGTLPPDLTRKTREALREDARLWVDASRIAMQKFENVEKFPTTIYLCGGGAMLPDIQDTIVSYPWSNFLPFEKHPNVVLATPNKQDKVIDTTGKLTYPYDVTPIALARYFYDIINKPNYNYVGFNYEN